MQWCTTFMVTGGDPRLPHGQALRGPLSVSEASAMSWRLRMARIIWYRRRGVVADRSVAEDLFAYGSRAGFWRVLQLFKKRISPAFDWSLMIVVQLD
jgi:hypothetical protein